MFDDRLQMEIDEDEGVLYGRVLNVARDGVTFSGRTVAEAKEDFTRAVEDYPRAVRPGRP
ncbi:MAG: type II toxin-antitoxin system HicB family antitoxin [Armatimonadetes bacterium]|nr:type II toxin-antitoxin system HicB family antitoxin [Armatimonadota bacterium]PIU62070.1 MAG: toxin-antitoxin system HicB family antitoxin [Armatimonadetes bacterium CG07_land_8_20_14_0_80_59_28]PIX39415.1 MAG: toxin-antitoxin system HicB family antitoxin [Armatimonadetes bacterium CG_4_8_14_3_um_filter_58_9]